MKRVFAMVSLAAALVAAPAVAQQPPAPGAGQTPGAAPGHVMPRPPPHVIHDGPRGLDRAQPRAVHADPRDVPQVAPAALPPHGDVGHADFAPADVSDPHHALPGHPAPHREGAGLGDEGAAHEEGGHGEGGGHAEEHGPPKPINWFDFDNKAQPPFGAMILNFVLLIGMYVYFGKKPVADALKNRRVEIAKEIEEAQRMRKEAEERAEKYQEKLRHLEDELKDTRAALVEAGKADRDRIVRDAEEKAVRMEKDAAFLIEQEVKQLRQDLTREAVEIAVTAAEELLKKRVTPVDQERLAEDYLAELALKTKATPSVAPRAAAAQGGTT
jgi:F-type H+-transporting ATPase subunit b